MKLLDCSAPRWVDASRTGIACSATFEEVGEPLLFHAVPDDPEAHGRALWARLIAGEFGPIADPPAPQPKTAPAPGSPPRVVS